MFWAVMLSSANRILKDTSKTPLLKLRAKIGAHQLFIVSLLAKPGAGRNKQREAHPIKGGKQG
jgi:hypothetical protein